MLIVNRIAPNSFLCKGAVIHPGINIISEKQEKAVLSCEGFKAQVDSGRVIIIRLPDPAKDERGGKPAKLTGHRVNDAVNTLVSLTESQAIIVASGIKDQEVLDRIFEVESRSAVLAAARDAQHKVNAEMGVANN